MPRYAFRIEYDGHSYSGWQRQAEHPSVQAAIEEALSRLEPDQPSIAAAGRTDAGVHATGQVAHVDTVREWEPFRLSEALNFHLKPHPVAITSCVLVGDDWHARFSANERRYLYRVICRRAPLVHDRGKAWRIQQDLDVESMLDAASHLIGKHDFTTFRSTMCQAKSPVKTLDEIIIEPLKCDAGHEFQFTLRARSFLHNQVRSIIGTLERVGTGSWSPERVKAALESKDRAACGPVAPPDGLFLTGVSYDPEIF